MASLLQGRVDRYPLPTTVPRVSNTAATAAPPAPRHDPPETARALQFGAAKNGSLARPLPRLRPASRDRPSEFLHRCSDLCRAWSAPARDDVQLVRSSPKRLALCGSVCKPTTPRSTRHGRGLRRLECGGDALSDVHARSARAGFLTEGAAPLWQRRTVAVTRRSTPEHS